MVSNYAKVFSVTKEQFLTQLDFSKPTVYVLRGIPGCGKSTLAIEIGSITDKSWSVCSADAFFFKNGEYIFDRPRIGEAHSWCLRTFIERMTQESIHSIFLDNTNTTIKEFSHYVQIAKAYDYKVVLVTLNVSVETSKARNVHQVPEKTIQGMYDRLNNTDNVLKVNAFCREHKIEHFNLDTEE